MSEKVVLVLIDGMRPDGMLQCGHPFANRIREIGTSYLCAQTVYPPVTLPCHMSLVFSVDPERHGILTNTYTPPVRPIDGLFEQLNRHGKKCAFFYNWEELRDLSRPDQLHTAVMISETKSDHTDDKITKAALRYLKEEEPDFLFLYLGEVDEVGGHDNGWMSDVYLDVVSNALDCTEQVLESLPEDYSLILTADHGGHGRGHGADIPEDMTIPICCVGKRFEPGLELPGGSIKDLAVTITKLMGVPPVDKWEGTALQMRDPK